MQKLFLEPASGGLDLSAAEAHRAAARSTQNQPQQLQKAATNRGKWRQAAAGKKLNET